MQPFSVPRVGEKVPPGKRETKSYYIGSTRLFGGCALASNYFFFFGSFRNARNVSNKSPGYVIRFQCSAMKRSLYLADEDKYFNWWIKTKFYVLVINKPAAFSRQITMNISSRNYGAPLTL